MENPADHILNEPLLGPSKGGLRTLPFIIANEAFEKVASYGLLPNMIMYLMGSYGMKLITGSNYICFWSAASNLAPIAGAFLADSYVGRFWMIGFGSIISLLGMFLLWLTAVVPGAKPCDESGSECASPNIFQLGILVSSFGLMSIGTGGIRSSSLAFGADQLIKKDSAGSSSILERFLNWYNFAAAVSLVVAMTVVVYIQENFGWEIGFGVPVMLMLLSTLSFFFASSLYIKLNAKAGSLIAYAQVLTASWKKRHLTLSPERTSQIYCRRKGSRIVHPTDRLRFLNKACLVGNTKEELTPDGTALDPWTLCAIEQVEELKALINVVPMWSTGIMTAVTFSQSAFPVLQVSSMNRHLTTNFEIPAGSFGSFIVISLALWLAFYDRVIIPLATRMIKRPAHLSVRKRMGIGLLLSSVAMAVSAVVEGVRRQKAIQEGFSDSPEALVHMSALWLLPGLFILGIAEAFFAVSQIEFFYSEFPKTMSSIATSLYLPSMSVASLAASLLMNVTDYITSIGGTDSWVSSNINKAHFDYYYWVLAGFCLLNFFYYLLCCRAYGQSQEQDRLWSDEEEITYE